MADHRGAFLSAFRPVSASHIGIWCAREAGPVRTGARQDVVSVRLVAKPIRALSVRLRWVADLALTLETQYAFGRICTVLLALSERFAGASDHGVLIDLKLTNEDLAAIAGVSRQFTNSTLQDLQKRGLLITQKRILILTDPAALETLISRL